MANDVEQYLAPIYRSEARFVLPLLSKNYPKKIWAKFESDNFKDRFGDNSVIPIWFADCPPGMFDETKKFGGQTFDPSKDHAAQVSDLVNVLAKQLEELRRAETVADQENSPSVA